MSLFVPPIAHVHTATWYVAHPDILRLDEKKCAGDAAEMPPTVCQNVAAADAQLSVLQMQKAAAENAAASTPGQPPKVQQ